MAWYVRLVSGSLLLFVTGGCANLPLSQSFAKRRTPTLSEDKQRKLVHVAYTTYYEETGSGEALAWLLFNGVRGGMSRFDIEKVLAQPLQPIERNEAAVDSLFGVEASDEFYQLGPTHEGWTCRFHFREGKLLNYVPQPPAREGKPLNEVAQPPVN